MTDIEADHLDFQYTIRPPMFRDQFDHEHHDRELEDWLRDNVTNAVQEIAYGARWVLFRDTNVGAVTIGAGEERLAMFPAWEFRSFGDWTGNWTVPAVATGAGTVRFRIYDYESETYVDNYVWDFDFDAATANNLNFSAVFSRKATEDPVHLVLMAEIISGAGTLAVADEATDYNVLVLGLIGTDDPAVSTSQLFTYVGNEEEFIVPDGISVMFATLVGGAGGDGGTILGGGALGSYMKVRFPVSSGETLEIRVGGGGQVGTNNAWGGWNGGGNGGFDSSGNSGGGGGGMTDIRRSPYNISDVIVIAGGGGGTANFGGGGGIAGWPVGFPTATPTGYAAQGGSQTAGGLGGIGLVFGGSAGTGTQGEGGDGWHALGGRDGGGGGAGWWGGGGGAAENGYGQGGGGGGSSYYDGVAGVVLISSVDGGGEDGNGAYVLLEW